MLRCLRRRWREFSVEAKKRAAKEAVEFVEDGFVVGVGSGTTVSLILSELAAAGKKIVIIPASWQSYYEAIELGLMVSSLDQHPSPDVYLDSFDQATRDGAMIKGGGGAMLREKVLASASRNRVFVGDHGKLVEKLRRPVPLEIIPFAYKFVENRLREKGVKLVMRTSQAKNGPTVSDNGNLIGDADFGEIDEPAKVEKFLKEIPGVVESGVFVGLVDTLIIVYDNGKVERLTFR